MSLNPKPRRLTPCRRHPNHHSTTALCGPCLHDRLSLLSPDAATTTAPPPQLHRCNTFSGNNSAVSGDETRRRSCDANLVVSRKFELTCRVPDEDGDGNGDEDEFGEGKTMKEFIDLELETSINRKSFLGAASIFSNKVRKWRKKQDITPNPNPNPNRVDVSLGELRLEDLRGRRLSYTQSEVGNHGLGRRSCDNEVLLARASIDCGAFGRKSCDSNSRVSIDDAGRASWDGFLDGEGGGGPVVSVIENAVASVYGFGDGTVKKETADAIGIFNGTKLLITEKELNEWRLKSLTNESSRSESFDTVSKDLGSVCSSSVGKEEKKCRQWSKLWSFLGLVNRRKGGKLSNRDEDVPASPNDLLRDGNKGALARSYSTSSSRASSSVVRLGNGINNGADSKAIVKRRQDDGVRYLPNDVDSGLLRLYVTPLRSKRRNRSGKGQLNKSHSLAKSVLKL